MTTPDAPMFAAADRNKEAILGVLREVFPDSGLVVEIASGGGQHALHFSAALPNLEWQPSEADPELLGHLDRLVASADRSNVRSPVPIDAAAPDWPDAVPGAHADAVISANLIHIAPWSVCLGLLAGAARLLAEGGLLCFYGPFNVDGQYTSEGNAAFDRSLRGQDPEWGLRDVSDLCDAAASRGFRLWKTFQMPANNLTLVFRRV